MNKNAEGYSDPTADEAFRNISREERIQMEKRLAIIHGMTDVIKKTADLMGFKVVGDIRIRDKATGKVYK